MTVRILVGDALAKLPELPDGSVDCIITDPPYGETSLGWDRRILGWPDELTRVLKPTGTMWVFGSLRMFWEDKQEFSRWQIVQDIVWEKHNGSNPAADRFRRVHEHVVQFRRYGDPWRDIYADVQKTNDATARTVRRKERPPHWGKIENSTYASEDGGQRLMRSVIYARSEHGRAVHPTQKPLAVIEPLLRYSCPLGGIVLDPFAGSGTTGVAAQRNGRDAILIEISPEYAAMARKRIDDDAGLFA